MTEHIAEFIFVAQLWFVTVMYSRTYFSNKIVIVSKATVQHDQSHVQLNQHIYAVFETGFEKPVFHTVHYIANDDIQHIPVFYSVTTT